MRREVIKLLLVDDVEENLVAFDAVLRQEGLEILKAHSGSEALELLLVHEVALAILDVQMPEMDGFELAELMRGSARTKHVPIIFVTAGARDPRRLFQGYETGAVDFLFKPIEPRVLKSKADTFLSLYRQRHELEQALRLNEMFVGILGHDLRNPLSTILNGARLLERQVEDEAQRQTLRRMTSAGERMTNMIEQLLDLTRARLADGVGLISESRESLDVAGLVRRTIDELRNDELANELVVECSGDCETTGDATRLLQLFSNLVGNALQHGTPGGTIKITIEGGAGDITVRVHNQGTIPRDLLPTIFDPFRQRPVESSRAPGLGLGLFIARQIAAAHGGDVGVESSEATGTLFVVRLPRVSLAEAGGAAARMRL